MKLGLGLHIGASNAHRVSYGSELILTGTGESTIGWVRTNYDMDGNSVEAGWPDNPVFSCTPLAALGHFLYYPVSVTPNTSYRLSIDAPWISGTPNPAHAIYDVTNASLIYTPEPYSQGSVSKIIVTPVGCVAVNVYVDWESRGQFNSYFVDNISFREIL